jgi:hypothetical protein
MIRGMHAMFYSSRAEALRAFLKEKLELPATDLGGGWLIYDPPEAFFNVPRLPKENFNDDDSNDAVVVHLAHDERCRRRARPGP